MPTSGLRGTCFSAFATMRLIEIAAMLGDTVPVVERHYRKLVSLRMAERLAKIPTRSWSATVMSELVTVREVAAVPQCSEDAVVRRFSKLPGLTRPGPPETRAKRRYRVLRIRKALLEKYLSTRADHPVIGGIWAIPRKSTPVANTPSLTTLVQE